MDKTEKLKNKDVAILEKAKRYVGLSFFAKFYASISFFVLLFTSVFWAFLGAKVQQLNSDQLVGPFLLSNGDVFKQANFPGVHSFLIKWPLFELIKLYHYSTNAFIYTTIGVSLFTVIALAYILYRIERRLIIFGTLCLALASVLLLTPIQPYPGALLPVSMAMIATRNIEYILFIVSLILLIKHKGVRNWQYWLSVLLLALLISSDKLFLSLSIGGSLIGVVAYSFARKWRYVSYFAHWFGSAFLAGLAGTLLLWSLNKFGITHITSSEATTYYGAATGAKNFVTGTIYATLSLFTNLGANPGSSQVVVKLIPHTFFKNLFSVSFVSYVVNILMAVFALFVVVWLFLISFFGKKKFEEKDIKEDNYFILSLMLILSSAIVFGLFVLSNHYYAVDARYLGIFLFTSFISVATYLRSKNWNKNIYVGIGAVLIASVIFGLFSCYTNYKEDLSATNFVSARDESISSALKDHPVPVLVGNYWRVVPLKDRLAGSQDVMPIGDCGAGDSAFSDNAWKKDLKTTSFAYILTLNGNIGGVPNCSLDQVSALFGKPSSSLLISGTYAHPNELLLFYDKGIYHTNSKKLPTQSTILPINLSDEPYTSCKGPTIMNVVAHQDDDLLFINPDVQKDISAGRCVRTIYVTAGDAGNSQFYWLSREAGAEAAYGHMLGDPNIQWIKHVDKISDTEYIEIAHPIKNTKISLVFILLPDGNLKGDGFKGTGYESLQKLWNNQISIINSVDRQSYFSKDQLVSVLETLMETYKPSTIRTQSTFNGGPYPDHSDHGSVSKFTVAARDSYEANQLQFLLNIPVIHYKGYPLHSLPKNLSGDILNNKIMTFLSYGNKDGATCNTQYKCFNRSVYGEYLSRQYTWPN